MVESDVVTQRNGQAVQSPGLRYAYACLPPHEDESQTGPGQIGVAFSAHEKVSYRVGGRSGVASYPEGSVVCSGSEPIVWSRVREPTEALEIYLDAAVLASQDRAGDAWPVERHRIGIADPVVVGVASVLRRVHVTNGHLPDLASGWLAQRLAAHVLGEYAGRGPAPAGPTRLSQRSLLAVHDLIEAELDTQLTLDRLAAEVHLSPFHFARAFKSSTGLAPHQFVTSRRIDRARRTLRTTARAVEDVARDLGFVNVSHFRRVFAAHCGMTPSAFRSLHGQAPARR